MGLAKERELYNQLDHEAMNATQRVYDISVEISTLERRIKKLKMESVEARLLKGNAVAKAVRQSLVVERLVNDKDEDNE